MAVRFQDFVWRSFNQYFPIVAGARDLITKLLKRKPEHRLALVKVLEHPWIVENGLRNKKPNPSNSVASHPNPTAKPPNAPALQQKSGGRQIKAQYVTVDRRMRKV